MKNKMVVFFIRAYNDIDHMTPIIYRLRMENFTFKINLLIFDINNNYETDFRLAFLKNFDIRFLHILEYIKIPFLSFSTYFSLIKFVSTHRKYNPVRILLNLLLLIPIKKFIGKKISNISPDDFLKTGFASIPDLLIFDQASNQFYKKLCAHSKKINITTISVPHGHNTLDNEMIWTDSLDIQPYTSTQQSPMYYQYVVFENYIIPERYRKMGNINQAQIKVLGSTRFCDEWIKILHEILPAVPMPKLPKTTLKIVFMLTKSKYNGVPEEVERSINFISKFPDVYLIVKPHTRGMKFTKSFGKNVKIVSNDFHSPILIEWADVVLFTMTSVIFDCLKIDKPALYMKNTHTNKLLSENYFQSWQVDCRDDLRDFIWKLKKNKKTRTYSKEDRDIYCKEIIEPVGKDVLGNYVKFISELL